ncbi:MAG: metallophosphoesterase [Bacteroidaceae bacterium]|nr:metallophosphoesterase [Bacteroidaceae bacterium]
MHALFHLISIASMLLAGLGCNFYIAQRLFVPRYGKRGAMIYMISHAIILLILTAIGCTASMGGLADSIATLVWVMYGFMLLYIPRLTYTIVSWVDFLKTPHGTMGSRVGFVLAAVSFCLIVGSTFNRYRINVEEVEITTPRLPHSFDGYRIVHFSDMHLETLYSHAFAQRVVNRINELQPHMIVFSGDLVNRKASELVPYMPILSQLQAQDGIYSVMGNHDYGEFVAWPTPEARQENLQSLYRMHTEMGWHLLNNTSKHIYCNNDSIAIVGVENWGEPPFSQYGNLEAAYPNLNNETFKLLISHNPRHWRAEVLPKSNIDLMMAGHTHALQMSFAGYSPAIARYPEWGGLYQEDNQYLYVNIGIGCTMIPTRLGATPEITVITLHSEQ